MFRICAALRFGCPLLSIPYLVTPPGSSGSSSAITRPCRSNTHSHLNVNPLRKSSNRFLSLRTGVAALVLVDLVFFILCVKPHIGFCCQFQVVEPELGSPVCLALHLWALARRPRKRVCQPDLYLLGKHLTTAKSTCEIASAGTLPSFALLQYPKSCINSHPLQASPTQNVSAPPTLRRDCSRNQDAAIACRS